MFPTCFHRLGLDELGTHEALRCQVADADSCRPQYVVCTSTDARVRTPSTFVDFYPFTLNRLDVEHAAMTYPYSMS